MGHGHKTRHSAAALGGILLGLLASCAWQIEPEEFARAEEIRPELDADADPFGKSAVPTEDLTAPLSVPAPSTLDYRIGPGDELVVTVVGNSELSGERVVGPDGAIGMPLIGALKLGGMTRNESSTAISEQLAPFFDAPPSVWVEVTRYENNKVYVLGRVELPGLVELKGNGSLLQVLAEAGGLPVREFRSFMARCAIIRGRDQLFWIDLLELLQGGNLALNIPLRNGDVVYIPDSEDTLVFVMGEVRTPGAVPIKVRLNLVQALAMAGGPTEDAELESVWLVRPDAEGKLAHGPVRIDFKRVVETADFTGNVWLKPGDIIYVARLGLGDLNYVLRKLQPALTSISLGAVLLND